MTSMWVCRRAMVSLCAAVNTRTVACQAALVLHNSLPFGESPTGASECDRRL